MARDMKMRARRRDGGVELLVLINHPMETGRRIDETTQQKVPRHFIQKLVLEHNGKVVATSALGFGVAKDPLFGFLVPGAKVGDRLRVSWNDNLGESGAAETTVQV